MSIFLFIFGLAVGSFLNVLIDRLPYNESILGRSHCDHCKKNLDWYDLVPVFSFLIYRRKSRCCRQLLSWQYPIVEIITGLAFLFISWLHYPIFQLPITIGIVSCLITIFFTDLKYQIIPDTIQLVLFFLSLLWQLVIFYPNFYLIFSNYIIAGLLVMAPIFFIWLITRGRGMGFGDVKLALNMGILLGLKGGLLALYFGFISGGIIGLILLLFGWKSLKSKIAFGPFLVMGTVVMFFWGEKIFSIIKFIYKL